MTLIYLNFDSTNNNSVVFLRKIGGPQVIYKLRWDNLCYRCTHCIYPLCAKNYLALGTQLNKMQTLPSEYSVQPHFISKYNRTERREQLLEESKLDKKTPRFHWWLHET